MLSDLRVPDFIPSYSYDSEVEVAPDLYMRNSVHSWNNTPSGSLTIRTKQDFSIQVSYKDMEPKAAIDRAINLLATFKAVAAHRAATLAAAGQAPK